MGSDRHLRHQALKQAEKVFEEIDLDDVDDLVVGVIRVQSWYRGHVGRRRALRRLEYHAWSDPRGGRPFVRIIHMVVYGFTLTIIVVALFINAIYGIKFPPESAQAWVFTSCISLASDYFVVEVVMCILTVAMGD